LTRLIGHRFRTTLGLASGAVLAAISYHGLAFWDPRSHAYPAVVGWFFEASDSSPQIVFGIVAGLLFRRRSQLREALGGAAAPVLGTLCLASGVGFHLWAQWVDAPDLMVVSLGLVVLGMGLILGGRPLARLLAAPLGILIFAIPFPGTFYNLIVYPTQLASAGFADVALRAVGLDVVIQGEILSLGGHKFAVIETCSGLRSVQTLALLAAAWAVFLRCSARHTACLLAASFVIGYLTNGIRVMVLVLDTRPEIRESHTAQGILMFFVGTVALSLVDRVLLRVLRPEANGRPTAEAERAARSDDRWGIGVVALALLVMAAAALALPGLRPSAPPLPPPPELPRQVAGWSVREAPHAGAFLGNVHFTQLSNLLYERDGQSISAFVGWNDRQLRMRSLLSDKNAVPGSGWVIEQRGHVELEPGTGDMERVVARRFAERSVTLHAYRGTAGVFVETLREALALDRPGSPFARPGRAGLLRLSTLVQPGPDGVREAEEELGGFLAELAPTLAW
jgi:exosortase